MTKIIVIICTYNRCRSLAKTLYSVAQSTVPASVDWEVVVVDNNSTDQTQSVVHELCVQFPRCFRYLYEAHPGKSHALNTGIRAAQGDILAFIDDDVLVSPTWLLNLTAPLQERKWSGCGGRTLPLTSFWPPRWLPSAFGGILFAHFDLGDQPRQLDRPPYGANMAFRRETFEKYGGFRTDLGPSPNKDIPRPNEDTELGSRVMAAGERLYYAPSAVVYHPIPEGRLKKKYFLAFWFDYGRATVREHPLGPNICGIQRRYLTVAKHIIVIAPVKALKWLFAIRPQKRFHAKCLVWATVGRIVEIYRRWFSPGTDDQNPIPVIHAERTL